MARQILSSFNLGNPALPMEETWLSASSKMELYVSVHQENDYITV